jgi:polar amino acid transport system substrate-binding protein
MPQIADSARAELAPGGRLRAALNFSNTLLISSRTPEPTGVAPDLARELARRAGATVQLIGYANAGLAADAAVRGEWDVAFIGAEPQRAGEIAFTPAYVEIEATYLVQAQSAFRHVDDVDRDGVHIVTPSRAAYTLYLQRSLRRAALIEADDLPAAFNLFVEKKFEVMAGLKPNLEANARKAPGTRLLEGKFTAVQQAMGVPKARTAAAAYLAGFVKEITASGLLRDLIAKHRVEGLTISSNK